MTRTLSHFIPGTAYLNPMMALIFSITAGGPGVGKRQLPPVIVKLLEYQFRLIIRQLNILNLLIY
jgi:hypothetical protein